MNRLAFIFIFAAALLSCRNNRPNPVNVTGEAIARAEVRRTSAQSHVQAVIPESSPAGKVHLRTADSELTSQGDDLSAAKKSLEQERIERAELQAKYDREHNGLWARLGRWIWRSFWALVAFFGVALVLRFVAAFATGGAWPLVAKITSTILNVVPGLSHASTIADNIHFRKAGAKGGAKEGSSTK